MLHRFNCSMDLACTYAMRRPELARSLAWDAVRAAFDLGRFDLMHIATTFLGAL